MEPPVVKATGGGGSGGESKMKSSNSMRQIANAAYGGLLAYGTVYDGLEKSAKVLGTSLKKESVQVVEHQVTMPNIWVFSVESYTNYHGILF